MTMPWLDLHNHVIPGVDDGARDVAGALEAVRALGAEGVRSVVATPHVDGSLTADPRGLAARLDDLDAGWGALTEAWRGEGDPAIALRRGVELKLDVPEVDLSDPRLRLGGGSAVLVEFPFMSVPPRSEAVLAEVRRQGYVPIVAHPERYGGLDARLETVRAWLDVGAVLQVNAPSLLGRYGSRAAEVARTLLARGWVTLLASDFHARGEAGLREARDLLAGWGGKEQAELMFEGNPSKLVAGEAPVAVQPLQRPPRLRRLMKRLVPW